MNMQDCKAIMSYLSNVFQKQNHLDFKINTLFGDGSRWKTASINDFEACYNAFVDTLKENNMLINK